MRYYIIKYEIIYMSILLKFKNSLLEHVSLFSCVQLKN